jgi:hypothetical protein
MKQNPKITIKELAAVPIAPDGTVYRCHSDLYFDRKHLALGNLRDANCQLPTANCQLSFCHVIITASAVNAT